MNIIQKLVHIPLQGNILKCCSILNTQRMLSSNISSKRFIYRSISSKSGKLNEEDDTPVKYTTSAAGKFKASSALQSGDDRLWYEPYVVIASLSVFLLYFLVLREENDLDEGIFVPLHDRIAGLEEVQLKTVIEHSQNSEEIASANLRLEELSKE